MPRKIPVSISFNYEEWNEIQERADKEHLNLATYIRWYLFDHHAVFQDRTPEPVRSGIPKRIVSSQIVHAIKRQDRMGEVLKEMEELFSKGLELQPVTEEMKMEVYKNRMEDSRKIKINIEELHPPK